MSINTKEEEEDKGRNKMTMKAAQRLAEKE